MSKHLLNNPEENIKDSLSGLLYSNNANIFSLPEYPNIILRKDYLDLINEEKVTILSGGGSGNEPAHSGFVGKGMLTAAVCGEIFKSPSASSILAALRLIGSSNDAGVLVILKNYTGDRLNFGIATKRALLEGIKVETVLVEDDVAFLNDEDLRDTSIGRRGLCGTIFIQKLAGALAEQKKTLKEIKETLDLIVKQKQIRTINAGLTGIVDLPNKNIVIKEEDDEDELYSDEVEIGFGIQGEDGREEVKFTKSYDLVKQMFNYLELEQPTDVDTDTCLIVNNFGGISNFELNIVVNDCCKYILNERKNFNLRRLYVGTFMSSLNTSGFSLSIFYIKNSSEIDLLDYESNTISWPRVYGKDINESSNNARIQSAIKRRVMNATPAVFEDTKYVVITEDDVINTFKSCLETICTDLIDFKDYLNELDTGCGDSDCGNSIEKLSELVLKKLSEGAFMFGHPNQVLMLLSKSMENCSGTLCTILALACSSAAQAFIKRNIEDRGEIFLLKCWNIALEYAIHAISEFGGAKANDRSILDPLLALNESLKSVCSQTLPDGEKHDMKNIIKNLVDIAYESAESTASMKPRVGRASYADPSKINSPDAGAMVISSIISSIYKIFLNQE